MPFYHRPAGRRYTRFMFGQVLTGIKRFLLWDYSRATWQYDVMVGLILAFLFLTPRAWFNDQPRMPGASRIAILRGHGATIYWLDAELLAGLPEADRRAKAEELLRARIGETRPLVRLEPALDSESELKGYIAFTRP
jgi:hypothetical protein